MKKPVQPQDNHEVPTEPLAPFVPMPSPPASQYDDLHGEPTEPVPPVQQRLVLPRPLPQHSAQAAQTPQPVVAQYPYLPAGPSYRPPTPAPGKRSMVQPRPIGKSALNLMSWAFFPWLIGMIFVCIEMILLLRFSLKLGALFEGQSWIETLYIVSDVFVWPAHTIFLYLLPQVAKGLPTNLELDTLCAVILYSFVSRLIVRFLKFVLSIQRV
ncbi:hypothetical protein [Tengunoibacter tsumagoiensis]|uniref:Uncharacterized protein n=1 Tax=Tengunoibacter tsumagoiensis TaxID=2014871 RepID=A0A401ZY65_9CHLR|nr:hypothetical protein [Tengunoibacter tsumagoiensis]GCE11796.1 hypothetical protein KTT_16550 [Tengunoibacter tsumagoiensis]